MVAVKDDEEQPKKLLGGDQATIGPAPPASTGRGAAYYALETALEFPSPIPLGLSDPDTSIHPLASNPESSTWLTGANQASADYAAFKAKYGRAAQAAEGAAVMKYGGKVGKVVGATLILGAVIVGSKEINGTQGEDGNFGPDVDNREPLPAQKEKISRLERRGLEPVKPGEVTTFEDFRARSIPGDRLEGHELLQHAILKEEGLAGEKRLSTEASKKNPVIALERDTHLDVNKAQAAAGTKDLPVLESLRTNAKILLESGAAKRREATKLLEQAIEHAEKLGLLKKK